MEVIIDNILHDGNILSIDHDTSILFIDSAVLNQEILEG